MTATQYILLIELLEQLRLSDRSLLMETFAAFCAAYPVEYARWIATRR